jgi:hypothetical protein
MLNKSIRHRRAIQIGYDFRPLKNPSQDHAADIFKKT